MRKVKFFYEPFYLSLDTVPKHDERFIGYGSTRNTQVHRHIPILIEFVANEALN